MSQLNDEAIVRSILPGHDPPWLRASAPFHLILCVPTSSESRPSEHGEAIGSAVPEIFATVVGKAPMTPQISCDFIDEVLPVDTDTMRSAARSMRAIRLLPSQTPDEGVITDVTVRMDGTERTVRVRLVPRVVRPTVSIDEFGGIAVSTYVSDFGRLRTAKVNVRIDGSEQLFEPLDGWVTYYAKEGATSHRTIDLIEAADRELTVSDAKIVIMGSLNPVPTRSQHVVVELTVLGDTNETKYWSSDEAVR
jgi:hypothetical protein